MRQWLTRFINLGIKDNLPFEQVRGIKVMNLVVLLAIFVATIFLAVNTAQGKLVLAMLNALTVITGLVLLYCHYKGFHTKGYLLATFSGSVIFFTSSLLYNNNMEFYLLLIAVLTISLMSDARVSLLIGLANALAFLFVNLYGDGFSDYPEVGDGRRLVNMVIWLILFLITSKYFNSQGRNYRKKIEQQNTLLEQNKQQLEHSNRQLEALNNTKEKLFSIVAHDVRSPVAGLKGLLDLFTQDGISREEFRELSLQMTTEVDRLQENLDHLLQWSRSQFGGIEVNAARVDLNELVPDTLSELQHQLTAKRIRISLSVPGDAQVLADPDHLRIIVRNLLSNAIKFSYEGGAITLSARKSGNRILLDIQDHGTGIEPGVLETLFREKQPAATAYGTWHEKGHGIGLLLCREFAEKNNGTIRVQSEPGKGSLFTVELPAWPLD